MTTSGRPIARRLAIATALAVAISCGGRQVGSSDEGASSSSGTTENEDATATGLESDTTAAETGGSVIVEGCLAPAVEAGALAWLQGVPDASSECGDQAPCWLVNPTLLVNQDGELFGMMAMTNGSAFIGPWMQRYDASGRMIGRQSFSSWQFLADASATDSFHADDVEDQGNPTSAFNVVLDSEQAPSYLAVRFNAPQIVGPVDSVYGPPHHILHGLSSFGTLAFVAASRIDVETRQEFVDLSLVDYDAVQWRWPEVDLPGRALTVQTLDDGTVYATTERVIDGEAQLWVSLHGEALLPLWENFIETDLGLHATENDASGNLIVAGARPSAGEGKVELWVRKYAPTGEPSWTWTGQPTTEPPNRLDVDVDGAGVIYVTWTVPTEDGEGHCVIVDTLSPDGDLLGAIGFDSPLNDLAVGAGGELYLAGTDWVGRVADE